MLKHPNNMKYPKIQIPFTHVEKQKPHFNFKVKKWLRAKNFVGRKPKNTLPLPPLKYMPDYRPKIRAEESLEPFTASTPYKRISPEFLDLLRKTDNTYRLPAVYPRRMVHNESLNASASTQRPKKVKGILHGSGCTFAGQTGGIFDMENRYFAPSVSTRRQARNTHWPGGQFCFRTAETVQRAGEGRIFGVFENTAKIPAGRNQCYYGASPAVTKSKTEEVIDCQTTSSVTSVVTIKKADEIFGSKSPSSVFSVYKARTAGGMDGSTGCSTAADVATTTTPGAADVIFDKLQQTRDMRGNDSQKATASVTSGNEPKARADEPTQDGSNIPRTAVLLEKVKTIIEIKDAASHDLAASVNRTGTTNKLDGNATPISVETKTAIEVVSNDGCIVLASGDKVKYMLGMTHSENPNTANAGNKANGEDGVSNNQSKTVGYDLEVGTSQNLSTSAPTHQKTKTNLMKSNKIKTFTFPRALRKRASGLGRNIVARIRKPDAEPDHSMGGANQNTGSTIKTKTEGAVIGSTKLNVAGTANSATKSSRVVGITKQKVVAAAENSTHKGSLVNQTIHNVAATITLTKKALKRYSATANDGKKKYGVNTASANKVKIKDRLNVSAAEKATIESTKANISRIKGGMEDSNVESAGHTLDKPPKTLEDKSNESFSITASEWIAKVSERIQSSENKSNAESVGKANSTNKEVYSTNSTDSNLIEFHSSDVGFPQKVGGSRGGSGRKKSILRKFSRHKSANQPIKTPAPITLGQPKIPENTSDKANNADETRSGEDLQEANLNNPLSATNSEHNIEIETSDHNIIEPIIAAHKPIPLSEFASSRPVVPTDGKSAGYYQPRDAGGTCPDLSSFKLLATLAGSMRIHRDKSAKVQTDNKVKKNKPKKSGAKKLRKKTQALSGTAQTP